MSADAPPDRATPTGPVLRIDGLTAGYDGRPVVQEVSLRVAPGEVVAVIGPNGSGKSTLLKAAVGLVDTFGGSVGLGDADLTGRAPEDVVRAGVGYVPQTDDVFSPLTVRENLEMGGYLLRPARVPARIAGVTAQLPALAAMLSRRAGSLSGGERKMLAVGRALMLRPAVFMLDEPTANLAPAAAANVLGTIVRRLAEDGAAVLLVEQRARAALAIADRAYVLTAGRVRMSGAPGDLAADPEFVESFLGGRRLRDPVE